VTVRYGGQILAANVSKGSGGFGFNLNRPGKGGRHMLSKVESGGGAEAATLRPGDLILEVNGVSKFEPVCLLFFVGFFVCVVG
jgi:predicted metalloprotease with PDZ domain